MILKTTPDTCTSNLDQSIALGLLCWTLISLKLYYKSGRSLRHGLSWILPWWDSSNRLGEGFYWTRGWKSIIYIFPFLEMKNKRNKSLLKKNMIFMICCAYLDTKPICCFFAKVHNKCPMTISNSWRGTVYLTRNPQIIQFAISTSKSSFFFFFFIWTKFTDKLAKCPSSLMTNESNVTLYTDKLDLLHKALVTLLNKLPFLSISTVRAPLVNARHYHCGIWYTSDDMCCTARNPNYL